MDSGRQGNCKRNSCACAVHAKGELDIFEVRKIFFLPAGVGKAGIYLPPDGPYFERILFSLPTLTFSLKFSFFTGKNYSSFAIDILERSKRDLNFRKSVNYSSLSLSLQD